MINAERRQLPRTITDIWGQLGGRVPVGLMNRVAQLGGEIPASGPGKYSIPHALSKADEPLRGKTLEERRQHNRALFPRG